MTRYCIEPGCMVVPSEPYKHCTQHANQTFKPKRKPIAISGDRVIFDDGTVWDFDGFIEHGEVIGKWYRLPDIPQEKSFQEEHGMTEDAMVNGFLDKLKGEE